MVNAENHSKKGEVSPSFRTLHSDRYVRTFGAATSPSVWSYTTPSTGASPRNAPHPGVEFYWRQSSQRN
jgi:hypothetical protein